MGCERSDGAVWAFGSVRNRTKCCCSLAGPWILPARKCSNHSNKWSKLVRQKQQAAFIWNQDVLSLLTWKSLFQWHKGASVASIRLFLQGLTQWGGWEMKAFTTHLASVWKEGRANSPHLFLILIWGCLREKREIERKRKRNIYQLLPICALTGDRTYNLGMCPDQELNLQPFGVQDDTPQWTESPG